MKDRFPLPLVIYTALTKGGGVTTRAAQRVQVDRNEAETLKTLDSITMTNTLREVVSGDDKQVKTSVLGISRRHED